MGIGLLIGLAGLSKINSLLVTPAVGVALLVDWYNQRADACKDKELKAILAHNRDEEVEHAAMTLEWIRRHSSAFDHELRATLFKEGPIAGQH